MNADGSSLIDPRKLLAHFEGDKDLFAEVVEVFTAETPERLEKFRAAMSERDLSQLVRLAHSLKGASATLQAEPLRQASYLLETAARSGEQDGLEELVVRVADCLVRTSEAMRTVDINSL
ncbi:hypothetical protein JCM15519_09750 [Fundidesulfovibrio butyratiphilus]